MGNGLEKCLIGLSFDDGRVDNYTVAYPILKEMKIPATFNITTGYVKGELNHGNPTDVEAMNVDMVKELFAYENVEIAGHGWAHRNDISDIEHGIDELKDVFGVDTLTLWGDGFASPGTGLAMKTWQQLTSGDQHNIKYARVSCRYKSNAQLKILTRKASRVLKWPCLYRLAYQDTLMSNIEDDILYSIPVLSSITIAELKAIIKYAIKTKTACILMLHSIVPDGKVHDNWDYETTKFINLCEYIKEKEQEGKLEICTSMNIWKRLKDANGHV